MMETPNNRNLLKTNETIPLVVSFLFKLNFETSSYYSICIIFVNVLLVHINTS
jgi:hypothetical protein